jgi:hypothetical protein
MPVRDNEFLKIKSHIITAVPLGIIYFCICKNVFLSFIAMLSTVLVDSDHAIDYLIIRRRVVSLKEMMKAFCSFKIINKNYFIFHSWEFVVFLGVIILHKPLPVLIAVFVGFLLHLTCDQLYNTNFLGKYNCKPFFYFFIYRLAYGFEAIPLRKNGMDINKEDEIL